MVKDPRELPYGYTHTFTESLGEYDDRLRQYGTFIMYRLKRDENDCEVELFYGKKESNNFISLMPGLGNLKIKDADSLNKDQFMKQIKTGLEEIMRSGDIW